MDEFEEMTRTDRLESQVSRLRNALKDIAYVGQNGSPVDDDPCAVARWCADRAKEALGMVPSAQS